MMRGNILNVDVVVVGGGASGLMAACAAAKKLGSGAGVVVIEKEDRVGRKLLAAGNGRCNLSNQNMDIAHYSGSCASIAEGILKKYNSDRLVSYFNSLGLVCRADSAGRIYPYSNKASSVLDTLRLSLQRSGVTELCGERVLSIKHGGGRFELKTSNGTAVYAKGVVLATGGAAAPKLGGCGYTYELAEMLGLECAPIFPALAPVRVSGSYTKRMKGIRAQCEVSLLADGRAVKRERGEAQFNEGVLSGICIFQLSRGVNEYFTLGTVGGRKAKDVCIEIDLMPDYSPDDVLKLLFARKKRMGSLPVEEYFTGFLEKRMAQCVLEESGVHKNIKLVRELTSECIERIVRTLKAWRFTPKGLSDINSAQVTAGGICAKEADRQLMCVKHPGLYIAGEALDISGECGGYNLHWAFASGIAAGTQAVSADRQVCAGKM